MVCGLWEFGGCGCLEDECVIMDEWKEGGGRGWYLLLLLETSSNRTINTLRRLMSSHLIMASSMRYSHK